MKITTYPMLKNTTTIMFQRPVIGVLTILFLLSCISQNYYQINKSNNVVVVQSVDAFQVQTPALELRQMHHHHQPQQLLRLSYRTTRKSSSLSKMRMSTTVENDMQQQQEELKTLKRELRTILNGGSSNNNNNNNNMNRNTDDMNDDTLLLQLPIKDSLYVDPITKESLNKTFIPSKEIILGDTINMNNMKQKYIYTSSTAKYISTSDTYINLLEPYDNEKENDSNNDTMDSSSNTDSVQQTITKLIVPFIPPPIRSSVLPFLPLSSSSSDNDNDNVYIPMRDLFTNPYVSFLYERGWRQGFQRAGFPGVDTEAIMALDHMKPSFTISTDSGSNNNENILVDMSCATGLFTRKFIERACLMATTTNTNTTTSQYPLIQRVIGADYSDSMLREARRRIENDVSLQKLIHQAKENVTIELVRLDVGQIPMSNNSVNAVHAGAAMHCWPDVVQGLTEIYRILKPNGGRYFATTFLSSYFSNVQRLDGSSGTSSSSSSSSPLLSFLPQSQQAQQQTFQYFQSKEELFDMLHTAGFERNKIQIDIVGNACVIIRCEK